MSADGSDIFRLPLEQFLAEAGAAQPTPGGGSITALTGSLALSMARMAANYTLGRKKFADREPAIRAGLERLGRADEMFRQLLREDIAAYQAYSEAMARPADDPQRAGAQSEALTLAIAVPVEMLALAVTSLGLIDEIKEDVNPRLLSDLAVAATLMESVARCAALNVRVNLAELSDRDEAARQREGVDAELSRAEEYRRSVDCFIASRF